MLKKELRSRINVEKSKTIIDDVRTNGDKAILYYTEKFDGVKPELAVSEKRLDGFLQEIPPDFKKVLSEAAKRITAYHRHQIIKPFEIKEKDLTASFKTAPLKKVGVYIPSGNAPLVSTVLMSVIPAKIAGVDEIIACSPPSYRRSIHPYIAGTLRFLG